MANPNRHFHSTGKVQRLIQSFVQMSWIAPPILPASYFNIIQVPLDTLAFEKCVGGDN